MGLITLPLLFSAYAVYQIYAMLRDNASISNSRYYDYGDLDDALRKKAFERKSKAR